MSLPDSDRMDLVWKTVEEFIENGSWGLVLGAVKELLTDVSEVMSSDRVIFDLVVSHVKQLREHIELDTIPDERISVKRQLLLLVQQYERKLAQIRIEKNW